MRGWGGWWGGWAAGGGLAIYRTVWSSYESKKCLSKAQTSLAGGCKRRLITTEGKYQTNTLLPFSALPSSALQGPCK